MSTKDHHVPILILNFWHVISIGSGIPRVVLGPHGQPYRVSLTSPQASTEKPARLGIHSNPRTVCRDTVIHTTVPYNTRRHDMSRKYEMLWFAQIRPNKIQYDQLRSNPIRQIRSNTTRSLPVALTYKSFELDCCCTILYLLNCNIILLGELIIMFHCVSQVKFHLLCNLPPTIVDRIYSCEDIVLRPNFQLWAEWNNHRFLFISYLTVLLLWWSVITISEWSPFQVRYWVNKIYSHQSFAYRQCRSGLEYYSGIVFSDADVQICPASPNY